MPEPNTSSKLSLTDAAVSKLVLERHQLRLQGNFTVADAIVRQLLECHVVVEDAPSAGSSSATGGNAGDQQVDDDHKVCTTRWIHVPTVFSGGEHGACMFWHHNTRQFCKRERSVGQYYCEKHAASPMCQNRVPCPLDARHGILPARAAHHISRCQSKPGRLGLSSKHWRRCGAATGGQCEQQAQDLSSSQSAAASEVNFEVQPRDGESGSPLAHSGFTTAAASDTPASGKKGRKMPAASSSKNAKTKEDWKRVVALSKNYLFLRSLESKVDAALDFLEARNVRLDSSLLKKRKAPRGRDKKSRGGGTRTTSSSTHHEPKDKRPRPEQQVHRHSKNRSDSAASIDATRTDVRNSGAQGQRRQLELAAQRTGDNLETGELARRTMKQEEASNVVEGASLARGHRAASSGTAAPQSRKKTTSRKETHSEQHTAIAAAVCNLLCPNAGLASRKSKRRSRRRRLAAFECCAGTGLLSLELCKRLCEDDGDGDDGAGSRLASAFQNRDFILIDRSNFQGKADSALRKQESATSGTNITRLQADLQDIAFEQLPVVQQMLSPCSLGAEDRAAGPLSKLTNDIVFYGKHLCGAASDVTLKAALGVAQAAASAAASTALASEMRQQVDHDPEDPREPSVQSPVSVHVALALCCHHLCEWDGLLGGARGTFAATRLTYIRGIVAIVCTAGLSFLTHTVSVRMQCAELLEKFQITAEDFQVMQRLCTCYRAHPVRFGVGGAAAAGASSSSTHTGRSEAGAAIALCLSTRSGRLAGLRAALGIKTKCVACALSISLSTAFFSVTSHLVDIPLKTLVGHHRLLINAARTAAVVDSGLFCSVSLKVYVADEISPENQLLIATTNAP